MDHRCNSLAKANINETQRRVNSNKNISNHVDSMGSFLIWSSVNIGSPSSRSLYLCFFAFLCLLLLCLSSSSYFLKTKRSLLSKVDIARNQDLNVWKLTGCQGLLSPSHYYCKIQRKISYFRVHIISSTVLFFGGEGGFKA